MEGIITTEIEVVLILVVISIVAVLVRFLRTPYTVALVLVGLVLAFQDNLSAIELTPELVLAFFLPPLVFEAAFHVPARELRRDLGVILTLAVPGVVLTTALVGVLLFYTTSLTFPVALLLGSITAATDPVAVVATFKQIGVSRRLGILVEAESLFNDGTAIVVFQIVLGLVVAGQLSLVEGVGDFLRLSLGGIAVGVILGYIVAFLLARIDDYLIETTLTMALAFGSYLMAEEMFHFSGVLAVVSAALITGNVGLQGMSPTTRIVLTNFWEYVAFLANSFVFLLIGMSLEFEQLLRYLVPALIAVAAVLAARVVTVYILGSVVKRFHRDLPGSYFHVLVWGGLRGAVSLALVLSLPFSIAADERAQLRAMTFAVVIFSLLVQATTIPALLRRLGLAGGRAHSKEYEALQGELLANRAARHRLTELHHEGALAPHAWQTVEGELGRREKGLLEQVETLLAAHPELQAGLVTLARREALRAQRAALATLASEGLLSPEVISALQAEVDAALQAPSPAPLDTEPSEREAAAGAAVAEG